MAADTPTSVPHQRISADITDLKRRTTILERVRVYGTGGDGSGGGGGVTDHGDLTGLGDDDHPQYLRPVEVLAGANVTVTDHGDGTITIAATGGGGGSADNEVHVGPNPPTSGAMELWYDTDAPASPAPGAGVPVGTVVMYVNASPPAGWIVCGGGAVSRTTYAALFAVIGITYGPGDGTNTFNVPNMTNGVFPNASPPGNTGGAASHQHTLGAGYAAIVVTASSNGIVNRRVTSPSWTATHQMPTTGVGSSVVNTVGSGLGGNTDDANIVPPFVGFTFIIKT